MAKVRLIQAINHALIEEMERDERVVVFGQDVEVSLFGDTIGLLKKFGPSRVRNSPISEGLMTGMAAGAAAAGWRPVCHMMYGNFVYTGFDAIANQVAKLRYMSGGQCKLPVTFLAATGGGRAAAAQHSDSVHPSLMNLGGIKVVIPASPADAKGLLKSAIRDDNPTIVLMAGTRGGQRGDVPDGDHLVPLGVGDIKRAGDHVTLVAIGSMVSSALVAADQMAEEGVSVEVVDPRCLSPLDEKLILSSVRKTGRLVVADEARDLCSAASHIAALAADAAFNSLKAPVKRVTVPDVAIPYAPPLEALVIPGVDKMKDAIRSVAGYSA